MSRSRGSTLALALGVAALVVVPAAALGVAGDFAPPSTSPEATGTSPQGVVAANLDGDAHTDLAVANSVSDSVTRLLSDGTGSGNFTATGTASPAGNNPTDLVAANLGGDASIDLAIVNGQDNTVTILLGPTFTAAPTSPEVAGIGTPVSIAAANLDGDANTDLAIGNSGIGVSDVRILLGSPSGDFTLAPASPESVGVNATPHAITPANLDGNASIDLAVAIKNDQKVVVLLNAGGGDFTAPITSPETVGSTPNSLAAADFNGDTNTDLAVPSETLDNVTILLGSSSGDFTPAVVPTQPAGDLPASIVAANLGGSASVDLAVANVGSDNVTILFGDGGGGFAPAGTSPETVGDGPISIAAANLGGTASTDLATANSFSANATILVNELAPPVIPPVDPPAATPTTTTPPAPAKCKKGQKLKKGKCVKKKRKKRKKR